MSVSAPPSTRRRWPVVADAQYEGSRIPPRVPTVLDVPEDLRSSEDVLQVNFGPNHPSTHGVLRLIVDLHGEEVVGVSAVIGLFFGIYPASRAARLSTFGQAHSSVPSAS